MSRRFLLGLLVCALAACSSPARGPVEWRRYEFARSAMGTDFKLVFYASGGKARAEAAAAAAFARIASLDDSLSDYDPESELSLLGRLSDAGPSPWIPVSADLYRILVAAAEVSRASAGAFDVTVGGYSRLWRRARRQGERPSDGALADAARAVGHGRLEISAAKMEVRLHAQGMRFDLGGIAKGFALDAALSVLAQHGIDRALVNGGGDVVVAEPPPGRTAWRVGIAGFDSSDPEADRGGARVELVRAALATSGDLERFVELDGKRYSHIIDPRTGMALEERRLATVLAPSGMAADGWATTISVLGPELGLALLAGLPGVEGRLVCARGGAPVVFESEGFPTALSSDPSRAPFGP